MTLTIFYCQMINASQTVEGDGTFSGRVSSLNQDAALMRIKINFKNMKYLNKKDKLEFWSETNPLARCASYMISKSNDYMLLKIPNYDLCVNRVHLTTGSYLLFESEDLARNIKIGRELVEILLKKRLALQAKLTHNQKEIETFGEKSEAVNQRYALLRKKLELEWQKELTDIEDDKNTALKVFKQTEVRLDDVKHKLEQYRVYDENLETDRWALDKNLYIKR